MPELPDVEVFKRYLNRTALHKQITGVSVKDRDILAGVSSRRLRRTCEGGEMSETRRHGKHLFARVGEEEWIRFHFGMTGFFKYFQKDSEEPEHVRLRFELDNGYNFAYDCQRKLGEIGLVEDVDAFIDREKLGVDPFEDDLRPRRFAKLLEGRRGSVKSALMNQSVIAGIGNIYSDEILFQADIDPRGKVEALDEGACGRLLRTLKRVLRKAVDYQVDPDRFPARYLLPHREDGADCPRCGGRIRSIKISGRTAYACDRHQKRPK